ncbi:MAG TPA: hypothetical protein VFZ17_01285, partial [Acidimicrobiia bacterium]|nr:hypothetical protein [Acidimicrobiia bacterium]
VLRTWQPVRSPSRIVAVVGVVVLLGVLAHAVVGNLDTLADEGASLRATAADQKVRYSALVVARADADRDLPMWFFPNSFDAGAVIDAISELDYPVFSSDELLQLPERDRHAADDQLYAVLGGGDASPRALTGAEIEPSEAAGGTVARDGACLTFRPSERGAHLTVGGDALGVRVEATGAAPVDVAVRAVAHGFRAEPTFTVAPGASRDLVLRPTGMAPWSARLRATDPFRVCAVG